MEDVCCRKKHDQGYMCYKDAQSNRMMLKEAQSNRMMLQRNAHSVRLLRNIRYKNLLIA